MNNTPGKILEAANAQFARHGLGGARLDRIAPRALGSRSRHIADMILNALRR
jgi:AcrR family transcriptional regulator